MAKEGVDFYSLPLPKKTTRLLLSRIQFRSKKKCWKWKGRFNNKGRPILSPTKTGEKSHYAYRKIYFLFRGDIPMG